MLLEIKLPNLNEANFKFHPSHELKQLNSKKDLSVSDILIKTLKTKNKS